MDTIILIPVYKNTFEPFEIKSLESVAKHLSEYTLCFIVPQDLNLSPISEIFPDLRFTVERFPNDYFYSIDSYSRLLMSPLFYKRFLNYKYILICQTDVYIFKNELAYWIVQDYDYIGAPWLDSKNIFFYHTFRKYFNLLLKTLGLKHRGFDHINKVGNGGFSLRKTQTFYDISIREEKQIETFQRAIPRTDHVIEDVFWSFYVPKKHHFYVPDYKTAAKFSLDIKPKEGMELNKGKLPFACHGFNKDNVSKFWQKYIK